MELNDAKAMLMSYQQNALHDLNISMANKSFKYTEKFKYLGMTQMEIACTKKLRKDRI